MSNARNNQSKQYVSVPIYPVSSGSGSSSDSEEDLFVAGQKGRKVVSKKTLNELLKKVPETVVVKKDSENITRVRRPGCCRTSTPCCLLMGVVMILFLIGLFVGAFFLPGCESGSAWTECLKHVPTVIENAWHPSSLPALATPAQWMRTFKGAVSSEAHLCPVDDDMLIIFGVRYFSSSADDREENSPATSTSSSSSSSTGSRDSTEGSDSIDFLSYDAAARSFRLSSGLTAISSVKGEEIWRRPLKQPNLPMNQVGCLPRQSVCFVAAFPGYLEMFHAKNGETVWSSTWGEAKLTASFIADVNNDSKADLIVLSYSDDGRSRNINGQTSMYLVSGADGKPVGRPLKIPGCSRLADPHVTDQSTLIHLHVTCFDESKNEHLLRLSITDLVKSAVSGTEDKVIGFAEKTAKRPDFDGDDQIDEEETDTGGVVHRANLDLRWINSNNGTAEVLLEGIETPPPDTEGGATPRHKQLWSKRFDKSLVTGGGFVRHCSVVGGENCPSVFVVKAWTEDSPHRRKRTVYAAPEVTVKPPHYHVLNLPVNEEADLDETQLVPDDGRKRDPSYMSDGGDVVSDGDVLENDENYDGFQEDPMPVMRLHTLSPIELDRLDGLNRKNSMIERKKTTEKPSESTSARSSFVVRVESHENAWDFHRMTEKVMLLKARSSSSYDFEEILLRTEPVEVACFSSADSTTEIFPSLGNCLPRPHKHSIVTEVALSNSTRPTDGVAPDERMVFLVSTTPTLERVDRSPDSRRYRLVTKVNYWRNFVPRLANP